MEALLTAKDVAAQLKCSLQTARALIRKMPHIRVGRLVRVDPAVLRDWLCQHACTNADAFGGLGSIHLKARSGSRRAAAIAKQPKREPSSWSERLQRMVDARKSA